ncbi:MAG TPA: dickkopf-related protein [Polyangia bacterium]|nr:dickkopf-related protein [Polyangia bacterium]
MRRLATGIVARVVGVSLATMTMFVAACSSSSNEPAPLTFAAFSTGEGDVTCQSDVACGAFADKASCLASTTIESGQMQADIAAGLVVYDGAAAGVCLTWIADTLSPTCRLSEQPRAQLPLCSSIFTGTVSLGGACLTSDECVSDDCDRPGCGNDSCCRGTCIASTIKPNGTVPVGAACTSRSSCVMGAYCNVSGNPPLCTALKTAGQACQLDEECPPGLGCVLTATPDAGATPTCAVPADENAPCAGSDSCDLRGDYCDPATMRCVPRVPVGGACVTGGDSCVSYAGCDNATAKCVKHPGPGDACSLTSFACAGSLACIAGHCAQPLAATVCATP